MATGRRAPRSSRRSGMRSPCRSRQTRRSRCSLRIRQLVARPPHRHAEIGTAHRDGSFRWAPGAGDSSCRARRAAGVAGSSAALSWGVMTGVRPPGYGPIVPSCFLMTWPEPARRWSCCIPRCATAGCGIRSGRSWWTPGTGSCAAADFRGYGETPAAAGAARRCRGCPGSCAARLASGRWRWRAPPAAATVALEIAARRPERVDGAGPGVRRDAGA